MSDHHVVCSTVLSTLSSSFSAYFKRHEFHLILVYLCRYTIKHKALIIVKPEYSPYRKYLF